MPYEVIGLGLCAWDRLLLFDRYPRLDQKVQALESAATGGGPVPTALAVFSKLGGRAAFIGVVGDDWEGREICRDLKSFGVMVRYVLKRPGTRSACAYIWTDRREGRRTVALDSGTAAPIQVTELPEATIRNTPLLLIDGRDADTCLYAAWLCRENGGRVILDAGSPRTRIEGLLAVTDHAVVSSDFVRGTYPGMKTSQVLKEICALGPSTAIITTGPKGGFWRENGMAGRYQGYPVEVVDSTGAGDAFHGGYLFALHQNWEIGQRCRFASAVAAMVCRGLGGRSTAPTHIEVKRFIRIKR